MICLAGVLLIGFLGYVYFIYSSFKNTVDEVIQVPVQHVVKENRVINADSNGEKPFSLLLLGIDERENDRGRSDVIIVITVNPRQKTAHMFNIPRDTRTAIIGKGIDDKINHAYAYGGVNMAVQTVEKFLDIPIDYYVQVNMEGFQQVIDLFGGVTVDVPFTFGYEGFTFAKGGMELNGAAALAYSTMRYQDPEGDRGRNKRQQQIIRALAKKAATMSTMTKAEDLKQFLISHVRTNLTWDQIRYMQEIYKSLNTLDTVTIKGTGTYIKGVYYYIIPEKERAELAALIKKDLE